MSNLRTAAQQALEVLEDWDSPVALPAMVVLKAALAEPVQEPKSKDDVVHRLLAWIIDECMVYPESADEKPLQNVYLTQ